MPLSAEVRNQAVRVIRQALSENQPWEKALEQAAGVLGKDGALLLAVGALFRRQKIGEIGKARQVWFGALGWYFARLFMWGAFAGALGGFLMFGPASVTPVTWALVGAMVFSVLIQVFTPWRLKREAEQLDHLDSKEKERIESFLKELEKEVPPL